jgi:hypothetical protein
MFQFIQLHCEIYGDPCMERLQALTDSFINVGLSVNVIHLCQFCHQRYISLKSGRLFIEFFCGEVGLPNFFKKIITMLKELERMAVRFKL